MTGTSEGGKKAAATRGEESLREAGRHGAEGLNRDPQKKSEASKKAAQTRGHESLAAAGREGGKHSHGGRKED